MQRVADYRIINESEEGVSLYSHRHNTTIMVSQRLFEILQRLREEYQDGPIDESNPWYCELMQSDCIESLFKYHFLEDSSNSNCFEDIFLNYNRSFHEVYLHVTQECNLRCTYCYARKNLGKNMMLPIDSAKNYIDTLYDHGVREFVLTGGEPLLNKDISQIICYINNKRDTYTTLLTNGTMLYDNQEALNGVNHIIVSMDVHGAVNRVGLDSQKVLNELLNTADKIKEKITVRSVISRGEEDYLDAMREKIEKMGMKHTFIPRLPNCADELNCLPDMLRLSLTQSQQPSEYRPSKCGAGSSVLAIDWNGDIYPCQNLMEKPFILGSLNEPKWTQSVFDSEIVNKLRHANVLEIEGCKDCWVHFLCGGGCRALAYKVYGSLNHRLDFFCDFFEKDAMRKLSAITYTEKTSQEKKDERFL